MLRTDLETPYLYPSQQQIRPPESLKRDEKIEVQIRAFSSSKSSYNHPERNEDSYFIDLKHRTFGVFDGVGGLNKGEVASRKTMECIKGCMGQMSERSLKGTVEDMSDIMQFANNSLLKLQRDDSSLENMATTASVVKLLGTNIPSEYVAVVANVGDSRVYSYRKGRSPALVLHTADDGIVKSRYGSKPEVANSIQEILDNCNGIPSSKYPELQELYKKRNTISQAVGIEGIKPNINVAKVRKGDLIIMTSDGVHDNLTRKQMELVIEKQRGSARFIAELLVEGSYNNNNRRRKFDDITAVVVEVGSEEVA